MAEIRSLQHALLHAYTMIWVVVEDTATAVKRTIEPYVAFLAV